MRRRWWLGAVTVAAVLLGACSGDDASFDGPLPELRDDEQAYADSFEEFWLAGDDLGNADAAVTAEQAECIAVRFVDRMGFERLDRYLPRRTLGSESDQWRSRDIRLLDEEVAWLLAIQDTCGVDEKAHMAAAIARGDAELQACVEDQFRTDVGQRMHELQWGGTEDEYEQVFEDFSAQVDDACGDLFYD